MAVHTSTLGQEGLQHRIKWLIVFRLAIAAVFVIGTLVAEPGGEGIFGESFLAILTVTLVHFAVSGGFGLAFKYIPSKALTGFALSQIVWDLVFTSGLVYVTGAVESQLTPMYWLTIVNAAALLFRQGAFTAAVLSGLLYGAVVDLDFLGIIPSFRSAAFTDTDWLERKVFSSIVLNTFAFLLVAYVSSVLSARMRQAEKMLAEKSVDLEDLEDLMKRIVESLTSGLATLDPRGRISYWNRAAEEITGFQQTDVRGRMFSDLFPAAKQPSFDSSEAVESDRPWRWETKFVSNLSEEKMLGFSVSPLRGVADGERRTLVIFQDLTKYRKLEEQIKQADRLAAVGELAARMAHEIRNPLTSISGAVEVLNDHVELKDQDRRLMEIVLRETDRLNLLLTDFLTFAKPSASQFEELWLDQLLEETASLVSKNQSETRCRISLDLEKEVTVLGDGRRLSQMIWNLLKNAMEAMPEGGDLRVVLKRNGATSELTIRDTGPGISPEVQNRLFQPFVTTKSRGTGLGLATVRRIVEEHGATIGVDTSSGGTSFWIRFPQVEACRTAAGGE